MKIKLSEERRRELIHAIRSFHHDRFDEEIGELRARLLLDFFLAALGPAVYNQGVRDAQVYLQDKLVDLDVEVHVEENPRGD